MIDFDFTFLQPETIDEAYEAYQTYCEEGKKVMYYGGGTEFISRARNGEITADIVIDMKRIPECQVYAIEDGKLFIGSGVTLSTLTDHVLFPLLSTVVRGIATRTARNKITVGGNLCSSLPYKEALLPFLLAESTIMIATNEGVVTRPIEALTELKHTEPLVQIITDEKIIKEPFFHIKRTKNARVSYPIVTLAAMEVDNHLRTAMSGLCEQPFQSEQLDQLLQKQDSTPDELSERALEEIAENFIDDELASKGYRHFVFKKSLMDILIKRKAAL